MSARSTTAGALLFLLVLASAAPPAPGLAQPAPDAARASKSVRGTLESTDRRLGTVIMKAEGGERLTWRLTPAVLSAAEKVKPGSPMIVIYRQTAANEKRVTALAFPGTADKPTYVNLTGERVLLRSAAGVDGLCDTVSGPFTESVIPEGERAEIKDACWCCAPFGGNCTPATRSGIGQAYLERCFE